MYVVVYCVCSSLRETVQRTEAWPPCKFFQVVTKVSLTHTSAQTHKHTHVRTHRHTKIQVHTNMHVLVHIGGDVTECIQKK